MPATANRRSPERPDNDDTRNANNSAERTPVSNNTASTARSRSGHGSRARRAPAATAANNSSGVPSPCNGFGTRSGRRGRATPDIGLPGNSSSATRNSQNVRHTDHARPTDAAARSAANTANAARNTGADRSDTTGARPNCSATIAATAARSRRYAAVVCGESLRGARATKKLSTAAATLVTVT